jgi:SAM-dependent methyltransferase
MEANIQINKEHYDQLYQKTRVDDIIHSARNLDAFLDDAIRTDTSWHGMYHGGFKNCLEGKRVLELGSGNGLNAIIMSLLGADVIATDISDVTELIISDVNAQIGTQVQIFTGDFNIMDFELESFDFIVGKAFLHHLTHELEKKYLEKVASLLKKDGEARFFEPAVNNMILDKMRWIIPVPNRPSILNKKAFQDWKDNDPHPERDNSSQHFKRVGSLYFGYVNIVPIGSIERFCRLLPSGRFNRKFRQWAYQAELVLPHWIRYSAARSQLICYRFPF